MTKPPLFMLDSGAYSAYYSGSKIDLKEYIRFARKYEHIFRNRIITLDIINDGKASYENWVKMRDAGVNPMPVYHVGINEPSEYYYLKKYLDETDYICFGGIARMSHSAKLMAFTRMWEEMLYDYVDTHKFHMLGVTKMQVMKRWPWYSVDSATCTKQAAYGNIIMPKLIPNGDTVEPDFSKIHFLTVSDRSDMFNRAHFFACPERLRRIYCTHAERMGYQLPLNPGAHKEIPPLRHAQLPVRQVRLILQRLYHEKQRPISAEEIAEYIWPEQNADRKAGLVKSRCRKIVDQDSDFEMIGERFIYKGTDKSYKFLTQESIDSWKSRRRPSGLDLELEQDDEDDGTPSLINDWVLRVSFNLDSWNTMCLNPNDGIIPRTYQVAGTPMHLERISSSAHKYGVRPRMLVSYFFLRNKTLMDAVLKQCR